MLQDWMKPVEGPHLYNNTKTRSVCHRSNPFRSVNVTLVLELRMQMTATSIFPNAQLERPFKASLFTPSHLLHQSQTHTHTHTHTTDTVRVCLACWAVMTNNSHALKKFPGSTHCAADGCHFYTGRP